MKSENQKYILGEQCLNPYNFSLKQRERKGFKTCLTRSVKMCVYIEKNKIKMKVY